MLALFGGNWNDGSNLGVSNWNLNNSSANAGIKGLLIFWVFAFLEIRPFLENEIPLELTVDFGK